MQAVLVTRGSRGMALFQPKQPTVHVPIFGSDEVADVTGAGDTVIATFGLALAAGASFYEAARLANYAGGLVVMKRGTATVSARELADAVDQRSRHARSRTGRRKGRRRGGAELRESEVDRMVSDRSGSWSRRSRAIARPGARIAFANGCFDLLHVGHVRYLQARGGGGRSADRRGQRRSIGGGAERAPAGRSCRRPIAPSWSPRCAASTTSSSSATPTVERLLLLRASRTCTAKAPTTPSTPCPSAPSSQAYGGRTAIVGDAKSHATRDLLASHELDALADSTGRSVTRFLIVRLGALGDIVHAIPVAAALRRAFPDARIDWLVSAKHREILDLVPVDRPAAGHQRSRRAPAADVAAGGDSASCAARATTSRSICRG